MRIGTINEIIRMYLLGFLICVVKAAGAMDNDESSVSINKPIIRTDLPVTWTQSDIGVRCFCNLPACVSTGYMCKSTLGKCFSDVYPYSTLQGAYRGRHGCVELLTDKEQSDSCQADGSNNLQKRKIAHPKSLLHCCYNDMCNHADDPQTKDLINDTSLGDDFNEGDRPQETIDNGYNNADVWFKAATIAVPICGAVILFALIALAVKLLRAESHQHTNYKLGFAYQLPEQKRNYDKHDHYSTSQSLMYKEAPHENNIYPRHITGVHRSCTHSPIILPKKTTNCYYGNEYNLLPRSPNQYEIQKCYENRNNTILSESCKTADKITLCNNENDICNRSAAK